MKFYWGEIKLPVFKCAKPKMTLHRGRTWDYGNNIYINGKEIKAWFDSTWGWCIYFEFRSEWYRLRMVSEMFATPQYDIDPTSNKRFYIITTPEPQSVDDLTPLDNLYNKDL